VASLLRNVGVNLLGFLAGKAAAAVAGILLLRALRPEAAGIYGAALGFAALFQCLADLGLSACLTKEVSAHPAQASRSFSRGLQAQALQVLAAGLGLLTFLWLGGAHGIEPALVLLAFGLTSLNSLSAPTLAVLQGLERFGLQGALATAASLMNALALALVLLLGQASPRLALQASLAAGCVGLALWWVGAWAAGVRFRWEAWSGVFGLWRRSLPFALVSVTNQLYIRVDLALLAWLAGPLPLGLYVAAAKLVDLMVPVLGALNGPLYARLTGLHSRAAKGDKAARDQAWGNLNRALRFMALICLPLGVGGSLLAGPLCHFAFGPDFTGSAPALAWLVWVPALIGIHGCLLHGLNAVGRTLRLAQVFGANLILNIGLNLWLIPLYGIVASAGISALCETVNLGAAWALARRAGLAPSLKAAFWPALPAALGMGLFLAWVQPLLGPRLASAWTLAPTLVLLGALCYGALLLLLGFLGADERAQLQRLLKRG
jgi:O-antigen/teichoic acid export membrane protein